MNAWNIRRSAGVSMSVALKAAWTLAKAIKAAEGNLQLAAMRPFTSMAQVIFKMHLHKVNKDVDRKVMEALTIVDFIDIVDGTEPVQPIEMQGEWQRGFYTARAGKAGRRL